MLSGSAVLRVGVLIVVAATLAGLVQVLRPRDSGPVDAPVSRTPPETGRAGTQAAVPPAVTRPVSPVAPAPAPQASPSQTVPSQAATPQASAPPPAVPAPAPNPAPQSPSLPNPSPPSIPAPSAGEAEIDSAAESAGPRGIAIVDLNTGSVAELNGLRGGGMIGRAIVQKRPYASVGELLSKRVLSRAVYERIKDQVTVR
jgi:hypothetical protein